MGKIPHLSLVAKPLVTHGEFYFSPLVASPLRGEKSNPFFSSVKDWVNYLIKSLEAKYFKMCILTCDQNANLVLVV